MNQKKPDNFTSATPKRDISVVGLVLTFTVTIALGWAALQWFALQGNPTQEPFRHSTLDEQRTFGNLQSIAKAQAEYIKRDWTNNGQKEYAKYYIHLWTSIDISGEPVRVGLIPRELAFATGRERAIDGYYFVDLQDRILLETGETSPMDHKKEWAVLAMPLSDGRSEVLHFIADNSGNIFAKSARFIPQQYINNPLQNEWTQIDSVQQLIEFQSSTHNSVR